MSGWLVAALVVVGGVIAPALAVACRGRFEDRLIGFELLQLAATVLVLCFTEVADRTAYLDVALVLAVLSPASALVFTKFQGEKR